MISIPKTLNAAFKINQLYILPKYYNNLKIPKKDLLAKLGGVS